MRLLLPALLALTGLAAGCGHPDDGRPVAAPLRNREEALARAKEAYFFADQQMVDMRTAPCIDEAGGPPDRWVVVVDVTGMRPFRDVASECPSFKSGHVKHAVVLNRDGTVRAAR